MIVLQTVPRVRHHCDLPAYSKFMAGAVRRIAKNHADIPKAKEAVALSPKKHDNLLPWIAIAKQKGNLLICTADSLLHLFRRFPLQWSENEPQMAKGNNAHCGLSWQKQQKSKSVHQRPTESARLFPKESFVLPPEW